MDRPQIIYPRLRSLLPHNAISFASLLDLTKRLSFGINLDDPWRYSGITPPRSIIIPHLLSASLPEGKILDEADEQEIGRRGEVEPATVAGRAVAALAHTIVDANVGFVRCWFPWKYFEPFPVPEASLDQLLEKSYAQWPMDDLVDTLTDRKSTRLNSSHTVISYAVFCLKKKTNRRCIPRHPA